jgi:hypothetical protein
MFISSKTVRRAPDGAAKLRHADSANKNIIPSVFFIPIPPFYLHIGEFAMDSTQIKHSLHI